MYGVRLDDQNGPTLIYLPKLTINLMLCKIINNVIST